MAKKPMNPGTVLGPVPAVLVSSGKVEGPRSIITLAWAGTVNSEPPMVALGVRKSRQSYQLIKESQELVGTLPATTRPTYLTTAVTPRERGSTSSRDWASRPCPVRWSRPPLWRSVP
ncbi:MAG: flavin reductase [Bacillota bacterium]